MFGPQLSDYLHKEVVMPSYFSLLGVMLAHGMANVNISRTSTSKRCKNNYVPLETQWYYQTFVWMRQTA